MDDFFLKVEDRTQLMTISGLWMFSSPLEQAAVRTEYAKLVERFPRFRQRVTPSAGTNQSQWEDDSNFSLDNHLIWMKLPSPGSEEQLRQVVGELMSKPFEYDRPLWLAYVIEGTEDGRVALLNKLHHCIADGQGSVRMLLTLTTSEAQRIDAQYGLAAKIAGQMEADKQAKSSTPAQKLLAILRFPLILFLSIWTFLLMQINNCRILVRRKRAFVAPLTDTKEVAWSTSILLSDVKLVKDKFKVTVNDVLLGCFASALREYMKAVLPADRVESEVLCGVPVSLRTVDDWSLSNKSSIIWQWLPASKTDALDCVYEIHRRMARVKNSPEALIAFSLLKYFAMISGALLASKRFLRWFMGKADCILTNVPGPANTLYFAGQPIMNYVPIIPQAGAGAMGIGIMTYANTVHMSVLSDRGALQPDSRVLTSEFTKQFNLLLERARNNDTPSISSKKRD